MKLFWIGFSLGVLILILMDLIYTSSGWLEIDAFMGEVPWVLMVHFLLIIPLCALLLLGLDRRPEFRAS